MNCTVVGRFVTIVAKKKVGNAEESQSFRIKLEIEGCVITVRFLSKL